MLARVPESNATFVEVKTLAMLTRPLRASGRLAYRRPAHLEKITLEPQAESLVVDGDKPDIHRRGRRAADHRPERRTGRSMPWSMPCVARCPAILLR